MTEKEDAMSTSIRATDPVVTAPGPTTPSLPSAVDWAAIIAGGVLATAISFILLTFGSAIGLSLASPYEGEGRSLMFLAVAAGLWLIWVQVSSFMAGGYLAGRLRRRVGDGTPHETEMRDGAHGLMVWALGVLIGAMMAASVVSGVAKTGAAVASAGAQAVGQGVAQAAANLNPMDYGLDSLFRSEQPAAAQDAAASTEEAGRILARSAANGSISAEDKTYLAQMIASRTGIDQPAAEQRIDQAMQTLNEATAQAKAAADQARHISVIIAFVTAVSLVISAAGAWWAAGLGGRHRDEGTDFSHLVRWR